MRKGYDVRILSIAQTSSKSCVCAVHNLCDTISKSLLLCIISYRISDCIGCQPVTTIYSVKKQQLIGIIS